MTEVTLIGLTVAIISIVGIVYPHILYPALLWVLSRVVRRPVASAAQTPTVDVVVAAYNEQDRIEACLRSIAASRYPLDRVRILVGDDGSTDRTAVIVGELAEQLRPCTIELHQFTRSGKNAVVSALIASATAEVVVFTDADTFWYPGSLAALVSPFADDAVGGVVGRHRSRDLMNADAGGRGDASYRSFEDHVNAMESEVASTVASNGALYAVRRSCVEPVPNSRVADDWVQLLGAVRSGKRVVTADGADVTEDRPTSLQAEVRRTVRTAASGMATVWFHRSLLLPTHGWPSLFLWSHRVIRWLSPLLMLTLLAGTMMSVQATVWFGFLFYGQFALYALALLGYAGGRYGQHVPIAGTCTYFVAMNIAFARALLRFVSGRGLDTWTPDGGQQ